jgi:hypothetical protein
MSNKKSPTEQKFVFYEEKIAYEMREQNWWYLEDGGGSLEVIHANSKPKTLPPPYILPDWRPSEPEYHFSWKP